MLGTEAIQQKEFNSLTLVTVDYTGLHFLNFFKSQQEELIILVVFFPADYQYLNYVFLAPPDLPKFMLNLKKSA